MKNDISSQTYRTILRENISWESLRKKLIFDFNIQEKDIDHSIDEGGLFIAHKRICRESLPRKVHKGELIELGYFLEEPLPVIISDEMIVYQDESYLMVHKPSGIPVQATRVSTKQCLDHALREKFKNGKLMSAHRLDRQTSGLVLYAMHERAVKYLMAQFQEKKIDKKYWAVVGAPVESESWVTKGYIYRDPKKTNQVYYRLAEKAGRIGRWSETEFRVLKREGTYVLLEVIPITGRTHQIRVHLKSSGHPIIGDYLYGQASGIRLQLHAYSLSFQHQEQNKKICFSVNPADFLIS